MATVEEALGEVEKACPCRSAHLECTCADDVDGDFNCPYRFTCRCYDERDGGRSVENKPCQWPGHAAAARLVEAVYGDAASLMKRQVGAELAQRLAAAIRERAAGRKR